MYRQEASRVSCESHDSQLSNVVNLDLLKSVENSMSPHTVFNHELSVYFRDERITTGINFAGITHPS